MNTLEAETRSVKKAVQMFVDQALFYNDRPNGNECKQKTKRNSNK